MAAKKVAAPRLGRRHATGTKGKPGTKRPASRPSATKKSGRSARTQPSTGLAFVCKMGEGQVGVEVTTGETVLDMLSRATFPPGTFKTQRGGDITNLIQAAEREVREGHKQNIAACFHDLRVDATPASLETTIQPGAVVTLVPKITGG